jgi:flavin reductase (DIM6/NTAB) family NADH-FMN oxidoreductase RutF
MAAAWHTSISFKPPLYGVSISPRRFTYQLIIKSQEFGVNFLPLKAAELIASVGGSSGGEIDKFQKFSIATVKPARTSVPILEAAYAAYECKLIDDIVYGDHHWLVGEIMAAHVTEEGLTGAGTLDLDNIKPALYIGDEYYLTTDKNTIKRLVRETYGKR